LTDRLFNTLKPSESFLISPSEEPEKSQKPRTPDPDGGLVELQKAFPELLSEDDFTEKAIKQVADAKTFGALVVRMDLFFHPEAVGTFRMTEGLWRDVAKSIAETLDNTNSIWGRLNATEFGIFLPHRDRSGCSQVARRIRRTLTGLRRETVSIGMALFPILEYERPEVLKNAYKAMDHAVFFGPDSTVMFDAVSLNISGDRYFQRHNITEAAAEYRRGLALDPNDANLHNSLGVCLGMLKQHDDALMEFDAAMQLALDEVMPVYNYGVVKALAGENRTALEYFLKADAKDGDIFEVAFELGKLHLLLEDRDQAMECLLRAIRLNPESGPAHRSLGQAYTEMEMENEAIAAYEKTVKLSPNDAEALSSLGYLYTRWGKNREIATLFCQQSVEIKPDDGLYRHRLGLAYKTENRLEEALATFNKATALGYDSTADAEKTERLIPIEGHKKSA
jgi:tetratricopeptide (TPR) repeat protein